MSESRMVINYAPGEGCRVAVVSDGRLEEYHAERADAVSHVGNIYVGRVTNVEPGIQAAFIDFGHESNGFLHISDLHPQYFPGEDKSDYEKVGKKTPRRERPPIQHCLKRGHEIIVQVLKEGIGTKGPTLTSYLSIPGRYLVMLPGMDQVGVSRRVEDEEARREMKAVLSTLELPPGFGFILRTAGVDRNKAELKRDLAYLMRLWKDIERRKSTGKGPRLLYAESDLLMRVLRDVWTTEISQIVIDDEAACRRAWRFMKIVSPRSSTKLLHYNQPLPVFHAFGVERQLNLIHERQVPLPSGGYLIFDEAEALVAIDVNSGKMRNNFDAETTAYKTNIEAVEEICRQLKLRDVGGLVVCDLIDMYSRSHRREIEALFRERLKRDRAATRALPISQFGIVELTRQRQRGSFRSTHVAECPECQGRGVLRKPDSVAADAVRELAAVITQPRVHKVELVVSPRVAGELLSNKRQALNRLEQQTSKHVEVRVSEDIPADQVALYAYDPNGADIPLESLPPPKPPTNLPEWTGGGEDTPDWAMDSIDEAGDEVPEGASSDAEQEELAEDSMEAASAGAAGPMHGDREGGGRGRRRDRRGASEASGAPAGARPLGEGVPPEHAGEGGGRRRRRRRRRGRGGGHQQQPMPGAAAESTAPARESGPPAPRGDSWDIEPAMVARGAPVRESPVPADDALPSARSGGDEGEPIGAPASRGDSWDIDQAAVTLRSGGAPTDGLVSATVAAVDARGIEEHAQHGDAGATRAEAMPPRTEDGGGERSGRRRRRRGRGRGKGGGGGAAREPGGQQPVPRADQQEPAAPRAQADEAPAVAEGGGEAGAEPVKKKGRRRRGGRGKGRGSGRGEGEGGAPGQPGANGRAGGAESSAASAGSEGGSPPTSPPTPKPARPVKSLYGTRRRLGPGEVPTRRGDE